MWGHEWALGQSAVLCCQGVAVIMSLRSGAGVDGLQKHSRVAVFGERDWSPQVHEQCIGRIRRSSPGAQTWRVLRGAGHSLIIVDTANDECAENWRAAVHIAEGNVIQHDQLSPKTRRQAERLAAQTVRAIRASLDTASALVR